MGTTTEAKSIIGALMDAVRQIPNVNPFVGVISLLGLLLLVFQSRISYKLFHLIPAPMWVLLISIPFVYLFNFFDARSIAFMGNEYNVGPELLINIPDSILEAIIFPDFSKLGTWPFWTSVLSITMIASIESLASSKAADKLDPYKRKTDLNKDLVGIGMSTMVSGMLGGLPIITVIVRSTVNVYNNAKTKWSNFYHGIILLLFIFLLAPLIQQVPLCALAILLVYTGFKLASPSVFKHVYNHGAEQLIFFCGTLFITLFTDLLIGIFAGLFLALTAHFLLAKASVVNFFKLIFKSGSNVFMKKDGSYDVKIKGIANFIGKIKFDQFLEQVPPGVNVNVDLSEARLVDFSIMENLYDFKRTHVNTGGSVVISGLEKHSSSSKHKMALRFLTSSTHEMTQREIQLENMAKENGWNYECEPENGIQDFKDFTFFKTRPIEMKTNCVSGSHKNLKWEISDLTFEEGAFMAHDEYSTTLGLIKLPFSIPVFTIEKKDFMEKYLHLSELKNIDYVVYHNFSNDYLVKVKDEEAMKSFMSDELRVLIEKSGLHHIESDGSGILIFNNDFSLAAIPQYNRLSKFKEGLIELIEQKL